jgi:RNA polymerase sigma factor (sigma-70 family)
MATGLEKVLEHIHRAALPDGDGATDGALLSRFIAERDEAAFAALVRRHGPMVLGVCRRVLRDAHDSEDCFQAVFLVLACKAASVVKRESLASWLHSVACRTALDARSANARRRARERSAAGPAGATVTSPEPCDWLPLLDAELTALAEKYRAALVLCDLEGRSRKEAAGVLGVPEGTLSSRLATARKKLAERLARRGVALCGTAALAVALPAGLTAATVRAAVLMFGGEAAAAATTAAATLMQGVVKAMFMQKLKVAMAAVLVVAALGGGLAYHAGGPGAAHAGPPEAKADGKAPSELEALRRENELLRASLRLALDKIEMLEAQVRDQKAAAEDHVRRAEKEAARLRELQGLMERARLQELEAARQAQAAARAAKLEADLRARLAEAEAARRAEVDRAKAERDNALKADIEARAKADLEAKRAAEEKARADALAAEAAKRAAAKHLGALVDAGAQVEEALKALRAAKDDRSRQEAIDALEAALKKLRQDQPARPLPPKSHSDEKPR